MYKGELREEIAEMIKKSQKEKPLADLLREYIRSDRVSLHIPGHKGGGGISEGTAQLEELFSREVLRADITEIDGFDDFHCPEGVIARAQELAADLFGAEETFFLVNGTTSGIIAAVAAAASEGETILVGRDCHKSVIRGLIFSGAMPVYVENEFDASLGIPCGISVSAVRTALERNPGVRALILTNPSYYGTCSQLKEITELCHSRGVQVIADEAHGAQLQFAPQEGICSALTAGCDISVQSTHKMLGSLTQSSMLHVSGDLVDRERLRYLVHLMSTTSPSYLLMASLDAVRGNMARNGAEVWQKIHSIVDEAAARIGSIPEIRCISEYTDADGVPRKIERSRLLISAWEMGIGGRDLADLLSRRYHIDVEFADHLYIIATAGSGTTEREFLLLESALQEISAAQRKSAAADSGKQNRKNRAENWQSGVQRNIAPARFRRRPAMTPRKAFSSRHETVPLSEACGRAAAFDVAVYPPGIPVLYPGEEITKEIRDYLLKELEGGSHVHGIVRADGVPRIRVVTGEMESMLFHMYF